MALPPRAENFCRLLRLTARFRKDLRQDISTFARRNSSQTFAKNFLMHAPAEAI